MDNTSSFSTSFDFNSQAGVMAVLTAIRTSALNSAEKNELRDLVFLYTNGGGDPSVRIALEAKLRAHQLVPVVISAPTPKIEPAPAKEPEPSHPFGTSRPAPVFSAPKVAPRVEVKTEIVAPVAKVTVPSPAPVSTPKTEVPKVEVVPAPTIVREPAPVLKREPVAMKVGSVPVTPSAPTAEAPTIPSTDADTSKYLDRIREIKATVNGKVGNPVNLVDINNEVGREYMNALLDAMKRLSGGAGQVEPAMARLELSFAAVLAAIEAHEKSQSVPAPTPSVPSTPEPVATPIVQTPELVMPVREEVPVAPTPVVPTPATDWNISETRVAPTPAPEPVITPAPVVREVVRPEVVKPPVMQTPVAPAVSEAPRILTPEDLPSPESLATSETGDPLYTREVDDGLEQLLSDWILFKKSGLFGTGPKGREHPLFKKIADLQITLLLAGRFEGSTQEIKQSITDYMNGWRYEQGIIYEQGETFEHYLRRVIKQILDLQKKRRTT